MDELHGRVDVAGRQHVAARLDAHRPVGKTVAAVIGADDQAGTHHQAVRRHGLQHFLLAQRLEWPVGLAADDRSFHLAVQRRDGRVLRCAGRRVVGIDRKRRNELVVSNLRLERLHGAPHLARVIATRVDHRVPGAPGQRAHIAGAIAREMFGRRKQGRIALPAIEKGDGMAALQRLFSQMPAEENCSADDKKSHVTPPSPARSLPS